MSTPSNTLIISGFDRSDFPSRPSSPIDTAAHPDSSLSTYVYNLVSKTHEIPVLHWGSLKSFGRVVAVFQSAHDAASARLLIQAFASGLASKSIRVYFGSHTKLNDNINTHGLRLPDQARSHLFYLSPPASPPQNASDNEDEFNGTPVHTGLHNTLTELSQQQSRSSSPSHRPIETCQPSQDLMSCAQQKIVSPATGRLMRRVTLHESSPSSDYSSIYNNNNSNYIKNNTKPTLNLQTDFSASRRLSEPAILTPTIVLEWDDDGEPETTSRLCSTTR